MKKFLSLLILLTVVLSGFGGMQISAYGVSCDNGDSEGLLTSDDIQNLYLDSKNDFTALSSVLSASTTPIYEYAELADTSENITVIELELPVRQSGGSSAYPLLRLEKTDRSGNTYIQPLIYTSESGTLSVSIEGTLYALYNSGKTPLALSDVPTPATIVYDAVNGDVRYTLNKSVAYADIDGELTPIVDLKLDSDFCAVDDPSSEKIALFSGFDSNGDGNISADSYSLSFYRVNDGDTAKLISFQENSLSNGLRLIAGIDALCYSKVGFEIETFVNGVSKGKKNISSGVVFESIVAGGQTITAEDKGYKYLATGIIEEIPSQMEENTYLAVRSFTEINGVKHYDGIAYIEMKNDGYYFREDKSLKILAIGNSFSVDATTYLYDMLVATGAENVVVGNAHISGCTIDKHCTMAETGEKAYNYHKYTESGYVLNTASLIEMVTDEEWDIITLQQASTYSGLPDSYEKLSTLVDFVLDNCPNKNVELKFHMTWAYQNDYESTGFENYDSDQTTMYNAIVSTVQEVIPNHSEITQIIPSGTAVQNLRTCYLGDTLTRDGYHMSYDIGRYTVGLTWACAITGASPDEIDWVPSDYPSVSLAFEPIREAVKNALQSPFKVTESKITEAPTLTLEDYFTSAGLDIDDYELLDWEPTLSYLWNSTSRTTAQKSTNYPQFIASKKFTKAELPAGTVIIVDEGYQYRPEGWQTADAVNSNTRPGLCTTYFTVVDEAWWKDYNYRAFNVSKIGKTSAATEEDTQHFHIYVTKSTALAARFANAGLDINDYELLDWEPTLSYLWNSTSRTTAQKSTNYPQFIASKKFTKAELPAGTVIIVDEGYQYRPEGWQTADAVNSNTRPGLCTTYFTVVDEAWWKDYNYRAFNVSKIDSTDAATEEDTQHFHIYVTKSTALAARFANAGLDINDYELLDWEPMLSYTWNSTNRTDVQKSTTYPQFIASKKFAKAELPAGTVIIVDEGYQYRPEGWQTADAKNSNSRPGLCSTYFTVVDEAWWKDYNYRAFNISKIDSTDAATEEDAKHFYIYVAKIKTGESKWRNYLKYL